MPLDLRPGTIFANDFRVVRPLSEGGMGAVFVVDQLSTGAQRALKLMRRELVADAGLRDRFLQEARVGSRIASDHVVQVIGAGIDPASNVPWLVMELLVGEELDRRVKRGGPLTFPEMIEAAKQLGHALAAAHAVGVIHRDLKPGNIFLAQARTAGAPFSLKVLDFGIAKVIADAQTTGTMGLGTPMWMAPEQTENKGAIGPATDVWAFGLIVFYALTGRPFWVAASDPTTGLQTLLRELLIEPIIPASQRATVLGASHALPPGFDAWFARCLERNPADRESHIGRAVDGLVSLLGGSTLVASPPAMSAPPPPLPTSPAAPVAYAVSGPAGASFTGFTPPPIVAPLPAPPPAAGRRSATTALLSLGALVVLGGAAGAYFVFGGSKKKRKRARSSDDDGDDDDDKPARPPSGQAEDCVKLNGFELKVVNASAGMGNVDDAAKLDAAATTLEDLATEARRLELSTQEGRRIADSYAGLLSEMASGARGMAAGARARDMGRFGTGLEKVQRATQQAEDLERAGAAFCGGGGT